MLFDSHAHLNLAAFDFDREIILQKHLQEGVFMINVGTCYETSQKAIEIAQKYSNCWASVGLHPSHTFPSVLDPNEILKNTESRELGYTEAESFDNNFFELLKQKKVVAIGECGLDYSYLNRFDNQKQEQYKALQEREFRKQIQAAKQHQLPLVLHIRDIYQKAIAILEEENFDFKAVFHFFSGGLEDLKPILKKQNFYLGFSGIITYSEKMDEIIKNTPWERILIETDAPYVAPVPYQGKRNEPLYVKKVAYKISQIKKLPIKKIEEATFKNALQLFGIHL